MFNALRRAALLAVAAMPFTLATSHDAQAQVNVDVNITLNGIVILDYYSQIDVTIPSAVLGGLFNCTGTVTAGQACDQGSTGALVATGNASQLTATPTDVPTPGPGGSPANVPLVLEDVWAVRAIATAGQNVNVGITATGGPLVNGSASIAIGSPSVSPASFAPPGLVNPTYGDVTLGLNLTNATLAGTYSSVSGQDYTLNVTLN